MTFRLVLTCSLLPLIGPNSPASASDSDEAGVAYFEKNVRPVLVARCYECHSAESTKSKGGLRLDTRDAIREGGDSGPAIEAGKPAESLLIRALSHADPDLKMPPKAKLPDHEVAALAEWVRMGAPDPRTGAKLAERGNGRDHWAFRPVQLPEAPGLKDAGLASTPIDRFLLAPLEAKGIKPAARADRRTLIRRATFDLTGLPPTPDEVRAFVEDRSPGAWEKVVDRLLASPHHGERWGRHWLDVVRYADTAGETADYPVPEAYRYRNYVIRSINRDKPYDEFVREQVAGDILAREAADRGEIAEDRYAEMVTATGFLAISRRFGFDTERYEHLTIQDSIDGVGQAVLGLSIGCARCHDHKFDPISARDYYALYGIFASTRYAFPGSERLPQVRAMVPLARPGDAALRWKDWDAEVGRVLRGLGTTRAASPITVRPLTGLDGDFELQAKPQGGSLGIPSNPWISDGGALVDDAAQSPFTNVYSEGKIGVTFSGDVEHFSLGRGLVPAYSAVASGRIHFGVDFRFPGPANGRAGTYRVRLGDGSGGVEVFLGSDAIHRKVGSTVAKIRDLGSSATAWNQLQIAVDLRAKTYAGTVGAPGDLATFEGRLDGWDGKVETIAIDDAGSGAGPRPTLQVDNVAISEGPPPEPPGLVASAPSPAKPEEAAGLNRRLSELLARGPFPQAYAVWEGTPRDVRVQKRGEPERPGEMAPRGFLPVLGGQGLPEGTAGSGRLELARWLTRPENPLTARVIVNRAWQHHFGRGLVATENDFGTRGRPPTHPELLDFLASMFVAPAGRTWERSEAGAWVERASSDAPATTTPDRFEGLGWSLKRLHRAILLSNVYQASGAGDPASTTLDPADEGLAWFPRQRLSAEALRDSVLALSGGLDLSEPPGEGGEHPFPAYRQTTFSQHGPFLADYDTRRRSVYLMTARIHRHPFLALFDGPDTNASTARRTATTVPTQALYLMNAPFIHDQSAGFGRRLIEATPEDRDRVALGFEMALARPPSPEESAESLEFLRRYREKLAGTGLPEGPREAQAWAGFARTLFARNEFFFVD